MKDSVYIVAVGLILGSCSVGLCEPTEMPNILLFHWDVYVNSAEGHYGITADQTNEKTIAYVRACVKETLLTYPQITGIGVTFGEDDRRELDAPQTRPRTTSSRRTVAGSWMRR